MKFKLFFLCALLLAVLTGVVFADNIVDDLTAFSAGTNAASFGDSDNSEYGAGSEWTSSADATVTNIAVKLRSTGSPTKDYVMDIYTVSGNLPNTLVGTSNRFDPSVVGATYGMYNFSFNGTPISNGVRYMFGVHYYDDTFDGANNIISGGLFNGAATGSYLVRDGGAGWGVWSTNWGIYIQVWNGTFTGGGNATITVTDAYTTVGITNFTAEVNGTNYSTTTGTLTLPILTNNTNLFNISIFVNNYFTNTTANVNLSSNYGVPLYPYTKIYAKRGDTNASISNFTITWNGTDYTTTTGTTLIPMKSVTNSNTTITTGGIFNNASALLNASPYLQNYTFTVWPDPSSVDVYIYDQTSGNLITENITLVVTGSSYEETFNTLTGRTFIGNLTAGTYSFKFSGTNYSTQTYLITAGTYTYQTLNAFLAKNTSDVTFTIVDFDSNAELEGATIIQQRLISNVWTTVSSKYSDITGRARFQYVEDVQYRFITSLANYTTKTFELDPVIFDSYTVRISRQVTSTDPTNYAGITWSISPTSYEDNQTYNITFVISSPDGALETYGFRAEYPGDSPQSASGTNAYGETLSITVNITGAGLQDTMNITFWYDTTITDNRSYSRNYLIIGTPIGGTWYDNKNTDYGMTTFEKTLLATMGVILVAGFGFMFGGALIGGLIGLFMLGWFYILGMLTLWMILPSILVGLVLIFWRSSE